MSSRTEPAAAVVEPGSGSVVAAIDRDDGADAVVAVAARLQRRLGLRLVLGHAVEGLAAPSQVALSHPVPVPGGTSGEEQLRAARIELDALARRHDLLDVAVRVEVGKPDEVIARLVAEEHGQLLVTGTRGHAPLRAALVGSVSAGLRKGARCPVVVVPQRLPAAEPGGGSLGPILCGVDGGEQSRNVLACAGTLAAALGVELVLSHVAPIPNWPGTSAVPGATEELRRVEREDAEAVLDELLASPPVQVPTRRRVAFGDPAGALADLAREEGAGLTVIGTRKRGLVAAAVLGSVSAELVACSPTAVVVIPPGVRPHLS
ncbi:MAG TPA: universal stress protein [Gaiellaceae bacterium]|jgi:nucleotide-binding universal stress UspA family protein